MLGGLGGGSREYLLGKYQGSKGGDLKGRLGDLRGFLRILRASEVEESLGGSIWLQGGLGESG